MWRINGSAKTPLPKEDVGKFYSGDCYIVLYNYHSGDRKEDYFLCCWIGKDSIEVIDVLASCAEQVNALICLNTKIGMFYVRKYCVAVASFHK